MDIVDNQSIKITFNLTNQIADIEIFKGKWLFLENLNPDKLDSLKTIATIESIGSSTRIEGSKLTDFQVESLLSGIQSTSLHDRDEQEVPGYAFTCEKIYELYPQIALTENNIKQIHYWLLQYVDKDVSHRGKYKTTPINIEAFDLTGKSLGVLFETTSPLETPLKMAALIKWTEQELEEKNIHPLIIIGLFIVVFLAIHPFQDGNGRLSRLLTTLLMLKSGYGYVPYTSLESIIEANKEAYYRALQITQKNWQQNRPDWGPWLSFFFSCLQKQIRHLELKIEGIQKLSEKMPPLHSNILNCLKSFGPLKISEIQALTQENRNTLKKALAALVKQRAITLDRIGKNSRYSSFFSTERF